MTLSQEPAISLCNLTTVFNRCILKESGSLPGSFSRPDSWSRKALRADRTAAAWKQVAYATRRRRRNPASGIPFTRVMSQSPSLLETLANTAITGKMRSILSRIRPDPWSSIKHPLRGIMDSKIQQKEYLVLPAGDDCSDA